MDSRSPTLELFSPPWRRGASLFCHALEEALLGERGWCPPLLSETVDRLGMAGTSAWIRTLDNALREATTRWDKSTAHVLVATVALQDRCWSHAACHAMAAERIARADTRASAPIDLELVLELRGMEPSARHERLLDASSAKLPSSECLRRLLTIDGSSTERWTVDDRFLARIISLFEPIAGLGATLDAETLRALPPACDPNMG